IPLAPTRFSITKDCSIRGLSICATMRATTSVLLPPGNGTMSLIGLLGHPALDVAVCAPELPAAKATISNAVKTLVIMCVPCGFHLTNEVKVKSRRLEHLGSAHASCCN